MLGTHQTGRSERPPVILIISGLERPVDSLVSLSSFTDEKTTARYYMADTLQLVRGSARLGDFSFPTLNDCSARPLSHFPSELITLEKRTLVKIQRNGISQKYLDYEFGY